MNAGTYKALAASTLFLLCLMVAIFNTFRNPDQAGYRMQTAGLQVNMEILDIKADLQEIILESARIKDLSKEDAAFRWGVLQENYLINSAKWNGLRASQYVSPADLVLVDGLNQAAAQQISRVGQGFNVTP